MCSEQKLRRAVPQRNDDGRVGLQRLAILPRQSHVGNLNVEISAITGLSVLVTTNLKYAVVREKQIRRFQVAVDHPQVVHVVATGQQLQHQRLHLC